MRRFLALMPALGLAIFALIVYKTGPARIASILGGIDPRELIWSVPLIGAIAIARGARWRYVMRCVGIEYGLGRSTAVWMIGFFASAVTPAKAGDAIRSLYVHDDTDRSMGETLLTVFVDRLWDLGFVLTAGVASALVFSRYYIEMPSTALLIVAAAVVAVAAIVLTRRNVVRALLRPAFSALIPERYREGLAANFHTFYDALRMFGTSPTRSLVMAGLTLACWSLIFLLAVYVAHLVDARVDPRYIILIMPIVTLVELLPFSVAGLGTRDATVIYFFSVVGIDGAEAVGFSITYLLIGTYLTALVGFILWLRSPVRWTRARGEP